MKQILLPLAALLPLVAESAEGKDSRPNIIVILSDDMGYSDIGCYGSEIETPALDELARNGVRLTQFYNGARSCPSRASLLTGLYPHQAGMGSMTVGSKTSKAYTGSINDQCVTMGEALQLNGYTTFASGKWHVCEDVKEGKPIIKKDWPIQRGFDRYYGIVNGATSYWRPTTLVRDNEIITPDSDSEYQPTNGYYFTDAITDNAIRYINETKKGKPFFAYIAYTAAHWPLHARPEDMAKYKGRYDKGYDAVRKARYKKAIKEGVLEKNVKLSPTVGDWAAVEDKAFEAKRMEVYAAMIDRMDQGIGRIIETLRERGELENTLIFFMEDNGACSRDDAGSKELDVRTVEEFDASDSTFVAYGSNWANVSNTPFRMYKKNSHEGGIATPLIAYWGAGIRSKGVIRSGQSHLMDIMATCLDAAGAKYSTVYNGNDIIPMEGRSLLPMFDGAELPERSLFFAHGGKNGVRSGDWKMACLQGEPWELYNMAVDRSEMNNLAEKMPEKVAELSKLWNDWATRCHVSKMVVGGNKKKK